VDALRDAFRGSDAAFLSMGTSATQVRDEKLLIDAATAAGVPYLVNLSVGGAGGHIANNVLEWHTEIDAYVATKDVASTLVRPATYVDTMVRLASSLAPTGAWGGHAGSYVRETKDHVRDSGE
jgi:NAD(P)H dehydrogenase (quinone)